MIWHWARIGSVVALLLLNSAVFAASQQDMKDCRASQDRDRQIAACTRIIEGIGETAKSRAFAYAYRGITYGSAKQDYDRAIADLSEAIRLNPKFADAYANRGVAFNSKKKYDRAIVDLSEAIRLNPKLALAYFNRGTAYKMKKDYERAIADYSEAIRLNPKFAKAYLNRGATYAQRSDYDRAIADLNEAIRRNPSFRAFVYERVGRKTDAISDYRKALLLNSSDKYAAQALRRLGAQPF